VRNTKLLQKKLERRDVFIAMMSERMGKATEWTSFGENGDYYGKSPFSIGKPSITMGHFPWVKQITRW